MAKTFLVWPFVRGLIITACAMLAAPAGANAATMRIAFEDREQYPYYLGEGDAIDWDRPGISVEIVKKVAEDLGIEVVFLRQPWKRCLISLGSGQVDAIFNSSFVKDRMWYGVYPGTIRVPDPYYRIATISYSLYRQKGSAASWDGEQLTGVEGPIGAVLGYSIVDDLKRMGIKLEEVGSSRQNLVKLAIGRVSGVVLQTVTGDQLLKSGAFPTIERVDPPIVTKAYYLLMSRAFVRDNPDMAARFWLKIAELRDKMTAQLIHKYTD